VLVVNLWAGDEMLPVYLGRLRQCFEGQVVLIDAQEEGNHVVFACRQGDFPPARETLRERVASLGPRHPVNLPDTAERLRRALEQLDRRKRRRG
jgi:spermidine synthase